MHLEVAHARSQALLRQRNMLLLASLTLLVLCLWLAYEVSAKDRELVLQPIATQPLTISTRGVSPDYLELVTRDTAYMILNRSPQGLDYWMNQVLNVVHPRAYGRIKNDLVKIVQEQKGSDVSQSFVMKTIRVDPKALRSEVAGETVTFVGDKIISREKRLYRFGWDYTGLTLRLVEFRAFDAEALRREPKLGGRA